MLFLSNEALQAHTNFFLFSLISHTMHSTIAWDIRKRRQEMIISHNLNFNLVCAAHRKASHIALLSRTIFFTFILIHFPWGFLWY